MKYTVSKQVDFTIDPEIIIGYLETCPEDLPKIVDKMGINTLSYIAAYYVAKCEREDPEQYAKFKQFLPKSIDEEKSVAELNTEQKAKSNVTKHYDSDFEVGTSVFLKRSNQSIDDWIFGISQNTYIYDRWMITKLTDEDVVLKPYGITTNRTLKTSPGVFKQAIIDGKVIIGKK